jgi:cytochrome c oxidase cbb3-type subunit 2
MPGYPWLARNSVEGADVQARMRALTRVGVPYSEAEIAAAPEALKGKTELDAMIAYLQGLGVQLRDAR